MSEALRLDPGIEHAKLVARRDMWLKLPAGSAAPHRALLMWLPLPQSRSAYIGRGTLVVCAVMHHPLHWEAPADEADPKRFAAEATAARPPAHTSHSGGTEAVHPRWATRCSSCSSSSYVSNILSSPLRGSEAVALHAREASRPSECRHDSDILVADRGRTASGRRSGRPVVAEEAREGACCEWRPKRST